MSLYFSDCHDVLVAGAGPVGLFLACELSLGGCSVLVLEQESDPLAPAKRAPFGLRGLSASTMESFDRRGLLEALRATSAGKVTSAAPWMKGRRSGGHFAGIDFFLDQIDPSRWPYPPAHEPMASDLASIEAVLTQRAKELGVTIRRGCRVSAAESGEEGVTVRAGGQSVRGGWLVGCDGGRSSVRKAAGFDFAGTDPEFTGYFAEVEVADPNPLLPGHHDTPNGTYIFDEPGMLRMAEFDGGAHHRAGPVTRDHVQRVLRRISGAEVSVSALGLAATWTDRAYLASTYRRGRVLLAGDAAHVHSPLGGQGLNLGLGDAMNLGWKLASVIRGECGTGLIDSYEHERRPVAEQVLDWSRAQVAIMRPTPSSRALRSILRDLAATRDGATYFAERVWGVGVHYDFDGDHPLVGRSAPNVELADGSRLNELLRSGRAVLLGPAGSGRFPRADAFPNEAYWRTCDSMDPLGICWMLVRPDGVVAWVSEKEGDHVGAARAVSQWSRGAD